MTGIGIALAAFVVGTVFGLWAARRALRPDLLDMDAVAHEQQVEIDTLTALLFPSPDADAEADQ